MKKGFSNKRLERRPYLVNLIRLEPCRGKRFGEKNIPGRWSRQMSFKMNSSKKVEREHPSGGFTDPSSTMHFFQAHKLFFIFLSI
jgi:hypothetical protein